MVISETIFNQMPDDLQKHFKMMPNKGKDEVVREFPQTGKSSGGRIGNKGSALNMMGQEYEAGDPGFGDSGSAARYFKTVSDTPGVSSEKTDFVVGLNGTKAQPSSMFYCPKASKSERDRGTSNYLTLEVLCVENTELAVSLPKDMSELIERWLTGLCGKNTMEKYQMAILSTTKTEINKTTILVTLNSKHPLNIKEYIVDALLTKKGSGGNPADYVGNTSEWKQIITNELTEFILGVSPALSREQLKTNASTNNHHATVKPLALMKYLIQMITPEGGVVLDPFAGSGSTLVAAKELGYDFIGIEMTEEYIPIIEARLSAVKNIQESLI